MENSFSNIQPPLILYYGEKARLDEDFAAIFAAKETDQPIITLDLALTSREGRAYYRLLFEIMQAAGGPVALDAVETVWQKAQEDADGAVEQYTQKESEINKADVQQETVHQIWADTFAKYATPPFVAWLKQRLNPPAPVIFVLMKNFEAIPSALQTTFERYLVPQIANQTAVKFVLFHEGNLTPSWKTYNFEKYVHAFSRVNPKLAAFQNPYIAGRPLRPNISNVFVGRQKELQFMIDNLSQTALENPVVLVGDRRIGKSSLLLHLEKHLAQRHITVFLDVQNFDKPLTRQAAPALLLWTMAYETCYCLRQVLSLTIPDPILSEFETAPSHTFRHVFLEKHIFPVLGDKKLLFLFDEFDRFDGWLESHILDLSFFESLRSLMLHDSKVAFVFAGSNKLKHLAEGYWSVLFNSAKYCELGFLEPGEARDLVLNPIHDILHYTPDAVNRLLIWSGCHAYFTQLMCSELVGWARRFSRTSLTAADVDVVAKEANSRGEGHLNYLWKESDSAQQWLLKKIAHSVTDPTVPFSRQRVAAEDAAPILERLIQRDILRCDNENIFFRVGLLYYWIKQNTLADISASYRGSSQPLSGEEQQLWSTAVSHFNRHDYQHAIQLLHQLHSVTPQSDRYRKYELLKLLAIAYQCWYNSDYKTTAQKLEELQREIKKTGLLSFYFEIITYQAATLKVLADFQQDSFSAASFSARKALEMLLVNLLLGDCKYRAGLFREAIPYFHNVGEQTARYRLFEAHHIHPENAHLTTEQIDLIQAEKEKLFKGSSAKMIDAQRPAYFDNLLLLMALNDPLVPMAASLIELKSAIELRNRLAHRTESATENQARRAQTIARRFVDGFYALACTDLNTPLNELETQLAFIALSEKIIES